jgi:hypothetical protein
MRMVARFELRGIMSAVKKENPMAMGTRERRERDIKLLVAKFIKLVESLNPGERLTIKKVPAKRRTKAQSRPRRAAVKRAARRPSV